MQATINERGNGFPEIGSYVPGNDGELYRVTKLIGQIQTGGSAGCGNWIRAEVDPADWDDCEEGSEFPAEVVLGDDADAEPEGPAWTLTIEGEGEYHEELDGDSTLDEAREWAEGVIEDGDYDLQPGEETKILCYLHRGDALEWSGYITVQGPLAQDPE